MICQTLAGRAGEALFFDHLTNRADSDLKKANNVVNKMVTVSLILRVQLVKKKVVASGMLLLVMMLSMKVILF